MSGAGRRADRAADGPEPELEGSADGSGPELEGSADTGYGTKLWRVARDNEADEAVELALECRAEALGRLQPVGVFEGSGGVAALRDVPVLSKDDLPRLQATSPPFGGMLGIDAPDLRRIYQSPGPVFAPEGPGPDYWRVAPALRAAGFRRGDIVLNSFSYHLTPGGHMMDEGLRAAGCVVVAGGVGNTEAQAALAARVGATGYVGTPQFLLSLLERGQAAGIRATFKRALVSGAALPESLRARLQDEHGVSVFQAYGTADVGLIAYECKMKRGMHVSVGVVVEVLDPYTREACGPGVPGEVVVTVANPLYPLVRFGTGDLSAFIDGPCDCGPAKARLVGILGRVGEGVKVRGMFVHPRQLAQALEGTGVARHQAIVTEEDHRDVLTVSVERPQPSRLPSRDSTDHRDVPAISVEPPAPGASSAPGKSDGGATTGDPATPAGPATPDGPAPLDLDGLAARLRETIRLRADVREVAPGTIPHDAPTLLDRRTQTHGTEKGGR